MAAEQELIFATIKNTPRELASFEDLSEYFESQHEPVSCSVGVDANNEKIADVVYKLPNNEFVVLASQTIEQGVREKISASWIDLKTQKKHRVGAPAQFEWERMDQYHQKFHLTEVIWFLDDRIDSQGLGFAKTQWNYNETDGRLISKRQVKYENGEMSRAGLDEVFTSYLSHMKGAVREKMIIFIDNRSGFEQPPCTAGCHIERLTRYEYQREAGEEISNQFW